MNRLIYNYYFRNSRWSLFIPAYLVIFEIVLPIKMFMFPFIFMSSAFISASSMSPLSYRIRHLTGFSLLKAVMINNLLLLVTGLCIFFPLATLVYFIQKEGNVSLFYQYLPLLIWSIVLGNIFNYFNIKYSPKNGWLKFFFRSAFQLAIFTIAFFVIETSILCSISIIMVGVFINLGIYYFTNNLYD